MPSFTPRDTLLGQPVTIDTLLRGEVPALTAWTANWNVGRVGRDVGLVVLGAGMFGAAMGCWRDPLQALYAGIKLPLILLMTASGNALLNALLAPLLGLQLPFRQCFLAILASFALACAILGAFSPLALFVIWNAPPLVQGANNSSTHAAILLLLVAVIAFAGIAANLRLLRLLQGLSDSAAIARRVVIAWLAGNLVLGSQLSWVFRPYIGSPGLEVEFLRATAFDGNFYEAVFHSAVHLFN